MKTIMMLVLAAGLACAVDFFQSGTVSGESHTSPGIESDTVEFDYINPKSAMFTTEVSFVFAEDDSFSLSFYNNGGRVALLYMSDTSTTFSDTSGTIVNVYEGFTAGERYTAKVNYAPESVGSLGGVLTYTIDDASGTNVFESNETLCVLGYFNTLTAAFTSAPPAPSNSSSASSSSAESGIYDLNITVESVSAQNKVVVIPF